MSMTRAPVPLSCGELFCGAGGLSRGFHARGFRSLFANDVWDVALHTFRMNFDAAYSASPRISGTATVGDVLALPGSVEALNPVEILARTPGADGGPLRVGDLDVLLGGPPCQGYSLNSHIRSASDPRNHLFRHYVRLLRGIAPKVFVLENVPGMLSLDDGRFFDELLKTIRACASQSCPGYVVNYKILNAAHYGVPQERFRIIVVGTRRDVASAVGQVDLPLPVHFSRAQAHFKGGRTHTFHDAIGHRGRTEQATSPLEIVRLLAPLSVREAIGDLPRLSNGGGVDDRAYNDQPAATEPKTNFQRAMRAGAERLSNHWSRTLCRENVARAKHIPERGDWRDIPRSLLPPGMKLALRKDHTTRYGRLDPDGLAGTLLTKPDPHWGTFLHYDLKQQRLISVREAARIQSFPDSHIFCGKQVDQYRLCGNAVPPLMAAAIAAEVRTTVERFNEQSAGPVAARAGTRRRA